jgi:hypothetical protein
MWFEKYVVEDIPLPLPKPRKNYVLICGPVFDRTA